MKREVLEGDKADAAHKKVSKSAGKMLRIRREADEPSIDDAHRPTSLSMPSGRPEIE
jgi:hypothetical protein